MTQTPDFTAENHGSVVLFRPVSTRAARWVEDNVPLEGWQWLGHAFAVDHRCALGLLEGIVEAGFDVREN
jgi:hypothetical protein